MRNASLICALSEASFSLSPHSFERPISRNVLYVRALRSSECAFCVPLTALVIYRTQQIRLTTLTVYANKTGYSESTIGQYLEQMTFDDSGHTT